VSAARLGYRRVALCHAVSAVRHDPGSLTRYRNLLNVARMTMPAGRRVTARADSAVESARRRAPARGAVHGVVVTFGRPDSLRALIGELASTDLATLTVVDNAPSPESKDAAHAAADALTTSYIAMPENAGPGGGYAAGMGHVLETAADDDWIVILDDDGLIGEAQLVTALARFGEWLVERGAPVGAVGVAGARFDRRRGRLVRPHDEELGGPVTVDYIAGNQLPTIRVAAAREVGVFDAALFFGFDDLDYCLRLREHGFAVYADGREWLDARRRHGRLGGSVGRASRRMSAWRRYYSVRNHVVIMRRYASVPAAIIVTTGLLFGRPLVDVARRRADVLTMTIVGARACADAWTGRLGRRMEPPTGAQ
jgi:hypothetical protein